MLSSGECPICNKILVESDRCSKHNLRFYDKVSHTFAESYRGYNKHIDIKIDALNIHHLNRLRYRNTMNKENVIESDTYIKLIITEDDMFDDIYNEVRNLTT